MRLLIEADDGTPLLDLPGGEGIEHLPKTNDDAVRCLYRLNDALACVCAVLPRPPATPTADTPPRPRLLS